MTPQKAFAMIAVAALCTFATRVAPFLLFNGKKPIPPIVRYLGETLPPAVIALLVIYCVKSVDWLAVPHGAPELLCMLSLRCCTSGNGTTCYRSASAPSCICFWCRVYLSDALSIPDRIGFPMRFFISRPRILWYNKAS